MYRDSVLLHGALLRNQRDHRLITAIANEFRHTQNKEVYEEVSANADDC